MFVGSRFNEEAASNRKRNRGLRKTWGLFHRLGRFGPLALGLVALLLFANFAQCAAPLTLEALRKKSDLTPERFGEYFRDFQFKLGEKRQSPDVFLATKSGDCDDFAALAADVLAERKYTTTLVAIFMDGQTHVVCYIKEIHGYLDYNLRQGASAVQPSDAKLSDIADKVAAYFRTPWRSVSEFTYQAGVPRFGKIAFH